MKHLYQASRLVSVKLLVNGCREQYQKLLRKVVRKQVACNEILAKQNLRTHFLPGKANQNMLTNPLISKMFQTCGETQLVVGQLRCWWV